VCACVAPVKWRHRNPAGIESPYLEQLQTFSGRHRIGGFIRDGPVGRQFPSGKQSNLARR